MSESEKPLERREFDGYTGLPDAGRAMDMLFCDIQWDLMPDMSLRMCASEGRKPKEVVKVIVILREHNPREID